MSLNVGGATRPVAGSNSSTPVNLTRLPNNLLEAFVPGYSLISDFVLEAFGLDVSLVGSICLLAFSFLTAANYSYKYIQTLVLNFLTASITVDSRDDIHGQIVSWVSEQKVSKKSRSLRARSGWHTAWDSEDTIPIDPLGVTVKGSLLVNFSNWEAKVPPRFEPHSESEWFWHNGHCFRLKRQKDVVFNKRAGFGGMFTEEESLTVLVFGRSTEPIKDLILEARDGALAREKSRTSVRRPGPKEYRLRGLYAWSKVATRPSRPIETVVLDKDQKDRVLMDINEYLHPATPRWYANRGIPYRRGYLFHGPPGTGKTSLSFAIAGVFGLDIFCISLLEPTLTEEDLGLLFNTLPRRCVVLLEDIDTAGLGRKPEAEQPESNEKKEGGIADGTGNIAAEVARAIKSVNNEKTKKGANGEEAKGISLSGFLNAIDGVASHEGRVLVMTTNHPEKLDDALIRPGRVDLKIEFTLATRAQIREIFVRMYWSDKKPSRNGIEGGLSGNSQPNHVDYPTAAPSAHPSKSDSLMLKEAEGSPIILTDQQVAQNLTASAVQQQNTSTRSDDNASSTPTSLSPSHPATTNTPFDSDAVDIYTLASTFAASLPEYVFSPAEIQGFLLMRKKDPQRAVEEVATWRDEVLSTRIKSSGSAGAGSGGGDAKVARGKALHADEGEGAQRGQVAQN